MSQPFALWLLFCFFSLVYSIILDPRDLGAPFLACYDYIICGGGISGLVLANRLTEDSNVTVLVLEAGSLDNYEDFILYPFEDGDGLGTSYDWNLWTTPQTYLDGAARPYDMGRGIGGGSLINGMCWTRGGSADFDAWASFGNLGWGWDDLLPYFKKSENYTDNIDSDFSRELYIQPNASIHGTDGYVHVSYPRYFFNQSQLFLEGLQELGIPVLTDPNNGTAAGAMLIPDSINPDNQTRSYARIDYFDTIINTRQNLHVATHQHVTRVLVEASHNIRSRDYPAGLWISGVEFLTDGSLTLHNVSCSREVILSAGAAHTPQILELSGIGDPTILSQFNIPVVINLPGVGNNFQDHPYVGVVYYYGNSSYFNSDMLYTNSQLLTQVEQEYYVNKTGPWTAGAINTVAFPSLPSTSKNWTNMMSDASNQAATQHLLPGLDPTIIAGYEAQKTILVDLLSRIDVAAYEILNDNIGLLAVATMHTFSRGSVHINSTNPLLQPAIDPRYCSNPLDCQILVEALLFNNQLVNTSSMKLLEPGPYYPFFPDATAETLMPAIQTGIRTEFHGTGSTSMLPINLGGVVDTHLRVYGTKNLRIVDAGIMPLIPAAHLQAPVYAIAEKAADIIKNDNLGLTPESCGSNSVFAQQGPAVSNSSATISRPISSPTASTFPQLLNSNVLADFEANTPLSSISSQPSFASGAAGDQLSSTGVHATAGDVILDAASVFLTSSSSSSSISTSSGMRNGQTISSITSTQHVSVLSSIPPTRVKSTLAPTSVLHNCGAAFDAPNVPVQAQKNPVPRIACSQPKRSTTANKHRSLHALAHLTPGCDSSSANKSSAKPLQSEHKAHPFGEQKTDKRKVSPVPHTLKETIHKSEDGTTATHNSTEQKLHMSGNSKATTYTSTFTNIVTVTVPTRGGSTTS